MKSIKREITYKRKLNESYQVFTFEEGDLLIHELEMLRKNQLQSLLPIEFMVSDGKGQFWYGITGLQSLEDMIKTGHMHLETLECMIKGIASALRSVEEYLLREQALSFEQIYFSHDGKRVYFAYYPLKEEYETDAKQQLLRLLDDLIKEADYSDKGYVTYLFTLYDALRMENASIEEISKIIPGKLELPKLPVEEEAIQDEVEQEEEELKDGLKDRLVYSVKEHIRSKYLDSKWEVKKKVRSLSNFKPEKWEEEDSLIATPKEEESQHKTQVLCAMPEKQAFGLLHLTNGEEIYLTKDKYVLGKRKEYADLVVEDASVSRVHALIMKEDDGYYLEDLNSLNGTYLNGSQLEIKEKVRLSSKDEIHIGKSCLVFQDLRY